MRVQEVMSEAIGCRPMVCDDAGRLVGVVSLQDLAETTSGEEAGETLQQVKSGEPDQPTAH